MTGATLAERRVLVTREEPENGPLSRALVDRGARVLLLPLLETRPPAHPEELARAATRIESYDWVFLTSARAVSALAHAVPRGVPGRLARSLSGVERRTHRDSTRPGRVRLGPRACGVGMLVWCADRRELPSITG